MEPTKEKRDFLFVPYKIVSVTQCHRRKLQTVKKADYWVTRCRKDPQASELSWRGMKAQLDPNLGAVGSTLCQWCEEPIYASALVVRGLWGGIAHVPFLGDSYKMGGSLVSRETLPGNLFMAQAGSRRPQGLCTLQGGSPARLKKVSTHGLQ